MTDWDWHVVVEESGMEVGGLNGVKKRYWLDALRTTGIDSHLDIQLILLVAKGTCSLPIVSAQADSFEDMP